MFAFAATQLTATAALRVAPRHARHRRRATSVVHATTDSAEESSSNTDTALSQEEREQLEGEGEAAWSDTITASSAATATRRGVIVRDADADIIDRGDGSILEAGAYTRPFFQLNVSTFRGIRWLASVYQRHKRLRLS